MLLNGHRMRLLVQAMMHTVAPAGELCSVGSERVHRGAGMRCKRSSRQRLDVRPELKPVLVLCKRTHSRVAASAPGRFHCLSRRKAGPKEGTAYSETTLFGVVVIPLLVEAVETAVRPVAGRLRYCCAAAL